MPPKECKEAGDNGCKQTKGVYGDGNLSIFNLKTRTLKEMAAAVFPDPPYGQKISMAKELVVVEKRIKMEGSGAPKKKPPAAKKC